MCQGYSVDVVISSLGLNCTAECPFLWNGAHRKLISSGHTYITRLSVGPGTMSRAHHQLQIPQHQLLDPAGCCACKWKSSFS